MEGRIVGAALLFVLTLAPPALADVVHLLGGGRVEGEVVQAEGGVRVTLPLGSAFIDQGLIVRVERTPRVGAADARAEASAAALRDAWARRDLTAADALLASGDVARWDEGAGRFQVSASYTGKALRFDVQRLAGAEGPLAVAFDPGTYGVPLSLGRKGQIQDLALLRAGVLVVPADQPRGRVELPLACALYTGDSPFSGLQLRLTRFERGSGIDRLMAFLCTGPAQPSDDAQLAIWIVRNGITHMERPSATFGDHRRVSNLNGPGARTLMGEAGLRAGSFPFFAPVERAPQEPGDAPRPYAPPAAPAAPAPAPAPRPEPRSESPLES